MGGIRVIRRDGDETLSDTCEHVMENKAAEEKKEEVTIFKKTTTGFKELTDDQLVKSLRWEQADNKLMIATVDKARQVERAAWDLDLADVTVVGRNQWQSSQTRQQASEKCQETR